jgi:hypothetical protein
MVAQLSISADAGADGDNVASNQMDGPLLVNGRNLGDTSSSNSDGGSDDNSNEADGGSGTVSDALLLCCVCVWLGVGELASTRAVFENAIGSPCPWHKGNSRMVLARSAATYDRLNHFARRILWSETLFKV